MMPEMDGFQFLHELRQNESWQAIPAIVVIAKDVTHQDRQQLIECQIEAIYQKGAYNRHDLLTEVHCLLAKTYRSTSQRSCSQG